MAYRFHLYHNPKGIAYSFVFCASEDKRFVLQVSIIIQTHTFDYQIFHTRTNCHRDIRTKHKQFQKLISKVLFMGILIFLSIILSWYVSDYFRISLVYIIN